MKMKLAKCSSKPPLVAFLVFSAASVAFSNGGPVATSQVHSAGGAGPVYQQTGVELVAEDLTFSPGMDFVDVTAVYTLYNPGEYLVTAYSFPVFAMVYPEEEWNMGEFVPEESILDFTIKQNGTELQSECSIYGDDQSAVREYGMTLPLMICSHVTELSLQAGDTTVVEVSYSVRATYEDWETSKEFFPGYEDRRFTYDLSPASFWGSGRAGSFTFTLDCRELFAMGGTVVETPEGGRWITEKLYRIDALDFPMDSLPTLFLSWESRMASKAIHLENHRISPDDCTITVSSSLGEGYGPENLSDGSLETAWCEGEEGVTGSWILLEFEPGVNVSWIGMVPGYAKSEHLYHTNARPLAAQVVLSMDGRELTWDNGIDRIEWEDIQWGPGMARYAYVFNRGESFHYDWIRITFTEALPGEEYEDLCVSELVVAGWN